MNVEKLIQSCAYVLRKYDHHLNYTKLIKLLYLSDKEALRDSIQTISGDSYVSMKNGPVLTTLFDLIKGSAEDKDAQSLWNARFCRDGYDLVSLSDRIPNGELSRYEKEVIDKTDSRFHDKTYSEMIQYVHRSDVCPEWRDPGRGAVPIQFEDVLRSIGCANDEIDWIIEENETFDEEEKLFATLSDE
jgi:hypothetical protein